MATLQMTITPTSATEGAQVAVVYSIVRTAGEADIAPRTSTITVAGSGTFDGAPLNVSGPLTVTDPGVTHVEAFNPPTAPGMTFTVDPANPRRFVGVANLP